MPTPTTVFHHPGPTNVFVPGASDKLQVEFSRAPETFRLMQYMRILPEQAIQGLYPELDTAAGVRVVDIDDSLWPDGQKRPKGKTRPARWKQWSMERRNFGFELGNLTIEQASYDVVAAHARMAAVEAMTVRSVKAATALTTAGSWGSNTVADVDTLLSLSGKSWLVSSTTDQIIKNSFGKIRTNIVKATGGVAGREGLMCVVNPEMARQMGTTAEVSAYLTAHEVAMSNLQGADKDMLDEYGLPPTLYGVKMIVEDAVKVSDREESSNDTTEAFVFPDNAAVFLTRSEFVAEQNIPVVDTFTGIFHEEMSVEIEADGFHRCTEGGVAENYDLVLTAPASGYYVQDIST